MFAHGASAKAGCWLTLSMCLRPVFEVAVDLLNVVGDMVRLNLNPLIEADRSLPGKLGRVCPHRIWNETQQLVGHLPKPRNESQGLPGTLMEIPQCCGPRCGIILRYARTGLGDELAAANVGIRLAVGKVKDDLVCTPSLRSWTVQPHFLGTVAQCFGQKDWSATEQLNHLLSCLHLALHCYLGHFALATLLPPLDAEVAIGLPTVAKIVFRVSS